MRHAPKCSDRRVEETASLLDPNRVTIRCAGCGAVLYQYRGRRTVTKPWPSLDNGTDAA